jgi:ESS family glutamate:Na+ symporter
MGYLYHDVLADFGIMSIIIVASQLLRSHIKFLQYTYIPSSVIAGLIALFGGRQFLNIIPFSVQKHEVQNIVKYPSVLIVFFLLLYF